jgi:hypothetical protein
MRQNPGKHAQASQEKMPSFSRLFFLLVIFTFSFSFSGSLLMAETTTFLKTETEFARLDPNQAVADAKRDIKEQSIKLFFEDRSEYPEILAIDGSITRQIPYTHISIGQGCLDPINDESCPLSYKESYQQALDYGRLYNQAIASHFELNSKAPSKENSSQQDANETALFLARSNDRAQVVMELSDIHPLFGGRNITVDGDGNARLKIVLFKKGDSNPDSYEFNVKLDSTDTRRLIAAFVDNNFVTLVLDENPQLDPDTARPTLIFRNSKGEIHRLTGWVVHLPPGPASHAERSPIERFDRIYKEMLRIERRIQDAQ